MQSPGRPPGQNSRPQGWPFDGSYRHPLASAKVTASSMSLSGEPAAPFSSAIVKNEQGPHACRSDLERAPRESDGQEGTTDRAPRHIRNWRHYRPGTLAAGGCRVALV